MTAAPVTAGTIVLVDDVMQTLATFTEGARAARAAGADRLVCIALVVIDGAQRTGPWPVGPRPSVCMVGSGSLCVCGDGLLRHRRRPEAAAAS
jgi:orotate phosphoribosyltransferase-like protein